MARSGATRVLAICLFLAGVSVTCGGEQISPVCNKGGILCPDDVDMSKARCACACPGVPGGAGLNADVCLPASINANVSSIADIEALKQNNQYPGILLGTCTQGSAWLDGLICTFAASKGKGCAGVLFSPNCSCGLDMTLPRATAKAISCTGSCMKKVCSFGPMGNCSDPFGANNVIDPKKCDCNTAPTNQTLTVCRPTPGDDPPTEFGLLGGALAGMSDLEVDPSSSKFNFTVAFKEEGGGSVNGTAKADAGGLLHTYGLRHDDGTADLVLDLDLLLDDINLKVNGHTVVLTQVRATGGTGTTAVHFDDKGVGIIKANTLVFDLDFIQKGTTFSRLPIKNSKDTPIHVDFPNKIFSIPTVLIDNGEGITADVTLDGKIANQPPVARVGADQKIECASPAGAAAALDGSKSTDPDGNIFLRSWARGVGIDPATAISVGSDSTGVTSPLGTTDYTFSVSDRRMQVSRATTRVIVQDTTSPTLILAAPQPDCLWAPNHKVVLYELGKQLPFAVQDTCDPNPKVEILGVTSNQPDLGGGQGDFSPDFVRGKGGLCLRSERQGTVMWDRQYTITILATDASGNKTMKAVVVRVPHDQSGATNCPKIDPARYVDITDPRCTQN